MRAPTSARHTPQAGYPVRRKPSIKRLLSLEYWIARRSLSSGGHLADPVAGDDDFAPEKVPNM
jgi:hypothetical protein